MAILTPLIDLLILPELEASFDGQGGGSLELGTPLADSLDGQDGCSLLQSDLAPPFPSTASCDGLGGSLSLVSALPGSSQQWITAAPLQSFGLLVHGMVGIEHGVVDSPAGTDHGVRR